VLEALYRAEVRGISMSRVQGHGGELDRVETYRGLGVVAQASWNGTANGLLYGSVHQLAWQAVAALAYAFAATFLLLRAITVFAPLRASEHEEAPGMDVAQHGEEAYASGEGAILLSTESGHEEPVAVAQP
jgi:ammonium transporter, Amt family